jgi:hypothetical protein
MNAYLQPWQLVMLILGGRIHFSRTTVPGDSDSE